MHVPRLWMTNAAAALLIEILLQCKEPVAVWVSPSNQNILGCLALRPSITFLHVRLFFMWACQLAYSIGTSPNFMFIVVRSCSDEHNVVGLRNVVPVSGHSGWRRVWTGAGNRVGVCSLWFTRRRHWKRRLLPSPQWIGQSPWWGFGGESHKIQFFNERFKCKFQVEI